MIDITCCVWDSGFFTPLAETLSKYYSLDQTMRLPNPPYQLHLEMLSNLGEIIYYGAQGKVIVPKIKAKYGAVAGIGNTPEEAIESCKKHADKVKGDSVEIDVNAAEDAYEELKEYGI